MRTFKILTHPYHATFQRMMSYCENCTFYHLYNKPYYDQYKEGAPWDSSQLPKPDNVVPLPWSGDVGEIDFDQFDFMLIAQWEEYQRFKFFPIKKVFLWLVTPTPYQEQSGFVESVKKDMIKHNVDVVCLTRKNRQQWGWEKEQVPVVYYAIDVDEYETYDPKNKDVIVVGNALKERNEWTGFSTFQRLARGLSFKVYGRNDPKIPGYRGSLSFSDVKKVLAKSCLYLNTTILSTLPLGLVEAMATGMPVVSTATTCIPEFLTDGENSIVSNELGYLRKRIEDLLDAPNIRRLLGERARETVRKKFSKEKFVGVWNEVFERRVAE